MKTIRILSLFVIPLIIISCGKDDNEPTRCSSANSIIVNEGKVLVSGWENSNARISTVYWIDTFRENSSAFNDLLVGGDMYKASIDELSRNTYVYKTLKEETEVFKFNQTAEVENGKIFYHRNNDIVKMDTSALGAITTICFVEDKPFFAGNFGEMVHQENGKVYTLRKPFFWDGDSKLIEISLPENSFFKGVSSIYVDKENNHYMGGLIGLPMYWKNSEPVILGEKFGEVNQIIVSGPDVYAVGLYNKYDSNSTSHTACYWKNKECFELEDNAQAYGIYIDGNDIYVAGSVGNVPSDYRACYWKNGIRVDLAD